MQCNVGRRDKKVRFWVGAILLVVGHVWESDMLRLLGLVSWVTGYFQFCGLYKALGMSTCGKKN